MSRRTLVLNNAWKLGAPISERFKQYAYAVRLSQFLKENRHAPRLENRYRLYDRMIATLGLEAEALQYLEFGVFKGDSIRYWAAANRNPGSSFSGFDSFEGLPEDWFKGMPKGAFDVGGQFPDSDDHRVQFVKGWFSESLKPFLREHRPDPSKRTVLHLDADLYSSTYYVLNCLYFDNWIKPGTVLIFDEVVVASIAHTEFRAFWDFVQVMNLRYKVIGVGKFEMGLEIIE